MLGLSHPHTMKKYPQLLLSVYSLSFLLSVPCALAQDIGIGTFSDLVGQARQASPQPSPSPIFMERTRAGEFKLISPTPTPAPFFSTPTVGFEYDYRLIHQKPAGGLTIDVNEAHTSFAFSLASTRFAFEYVYISSDGSNDLGGQLSVDSNGVKVTLTQPIGEQLIFSLPLFYKNDGGDAVIPTGPQTFSMDTISMNPLVIFSTPVPLITDNQNQPKPPKEQPLTFLVSAGYRLGATEKHDIHPASPNVDGWTGNFVSLVGAEYASKTTDGDTTWKITGNVTWNHLTNFYLSKPVPRPDDNGFGLAAIFTYNVLTFKVNHQPRLALKFGYQYDGFNRDQYQHSVTAAGSYRFW
jgi:hypothetical protein